MATKPGSIRSDIKSVVNLLGYGGMDNLSDHDRVIEERKRIARYDFREYMKLMYPGYIGGKHIDIMIEGIEAVERGEINRLMLNIPPRHSKAALVGTPVPTPSGFVAIENLRPGDKVFDENGDVCNVTWRSPIWRDRDLWRVTTSDGASVVVDGDHEWVLSVDHKGFERHMTSDLAALSERKGRRKPRMRIHGPIRLPEADLPIDPYLLGLWIADGSKDHGSITESLDDWDWLVPYLESRGHKVYPIRQYDKKNAAIATIDGLRGLLSAEGVLKNKHIPEKYLWSSPAQRLSLLQGIVDGDASITKQGQITITQKDEGIAMAILRLVRSLGVKASTYRVEGRIGGKSYGYYHQVQFFMDGAAMLPRKRDRCRQPVKVDRYVSFERDGTGDTVCIEVDSSSHQYLIGEGFMPTHNSMHSTEGFPAWYLGRHPDHRIINAAHTQRLAERFSRIVRNQVSSVFWPFPWVSVAPDNGGVGQWGIDQYGGGYLAVGVGSSPTGQGGDLILIDDPIRDQQDADSPTIRENTWEWFQGTLYTRRQPGAKIILTMTRWHQDDLAGRLIEHGETGGDKWHVINIPAENPDGTFLWPEFWSDEEYLMAKRSSSRVWNAQYMGRPSTEGGNMIRESWFRTFDHVSDYASIVVAYDTASKVGLSNDYTSCTVLGVKANGYDILHVDRNRLEFPDLMRNIDNRMAWAQGSFPGIPVSLVIEDASSGTAAIQVISSSRNYALYPVKPYRSKEKEMRVMEITPIVETGKVYVPEVAPWIQDFFSQITQFPYDTHDDMVDSFTLALRHAAGIGVETPSELSATRYNSDERDYGELSYRRRSDRLRGEIR